MLCLQFVFCAPSRSPQTPYRKGPLWLEFKTSIDTAGTQSHFSARALAGFFVIAGKHKISVTKPRLSVQ